MPRASEPDRLPFRDPPRAHVVKSLRRWIDAGALAAGQRLPAERELAAKLHVSRPTVRLALRQLQADGMIWSNEAGSRFVGVQPTGRGTLARTIAVLSEVGGEALPGRQSGGWNYRIVMGLTEAAHQAGLHVMSLNPKLLDGYSLRQLIADRPRGMILMRDMITADTARNLADVLRGGGMPVVTYGSSEELSAYDTVASDHDAGAYALTRWLIDKGRRRIVQIWNTADEAALSRDWVRQRTAGYQRALREAQLPPLPPITPPTLSHGASREDYQLRARLIAGYLAEHLTDKNSVDALLAASDGETFVLATACRLLGKTPGRDVLIAGYDNYWRESPDHAHESSPPTVTVDKQNMRLGSELIQMLRDRSAGQLPRSVQKRLIEPVLVVVSATS